MKIANIKLKQIVREELKKALTELEREDWGALGPSKGATPTDLKMAKFKAQQIDADRAAAKQGEESHPDMRDPESREEKMAAAQMKGEPMGDHVKNALELLRNGKAKTGSNFQGDLYQAATQPGINLEQQFDTTEPEVLQRLGFKTFRKEDFADLYMWLYPHACNFRQCGERIKINMAQNPGFQPSSKMVGVEYTSDIARGKAAAGETQRDIVKKKRAEGHPVTEAKTKTIVTNIKLKQIIREEIKKVLFEVDTIDDEDFRDAMLPVEDAVMTNPVFDPLEDEADDVKQKQTLRKKLRALLDKFVIAANTILAREKPVAEPEDEEGAGLSAVAAGEITEKVKKKFKLSLNELESEKRIGDPSYIQNIYEVTIRVSIHKTRGGDREQTYTEIRGIPGVTVITVDPSGTAHDETFYFSTLNIKFELIKRHDPLTYLKQTLFPGIRAISGLDLRSSGQIRKIN